MPTPLPPRSQQEPLPQFPQRVYQNNIPEERCREEASAFSSSHLQLQHVMHHPEGEPPAKDAVSAPRGNACSCDAISTLSI